MDFKGINQVRPSSIIVRGIAQGVIAADKTVNVSFGGVVVKCRVVRSVTLAAGDRVLGVRSTSEIVILDRIYATAPAAAEEGTGIVPPEEGTRTGTLLVPPVETRTWRTVGSWIDSHDSTLQGSYGEAGNQKGCAFYGPMPTSLAGATVTRASVKLKRLWSGVSATDIPTIWLVDESTRPTTEPTFIGSGTAGPLLSLDESVTYEIPISYAQGLVDGTEGGLGIYTSTGTPYLKFAGRADWAPAWTLIIEWERVA